MKTKKTPIMTLSYQGQDGVRLEDLGDLAEFRRAFARNLPDWFHNHQPDGSVLYRYPAVQYRLSQQGQPQVVLLGQKILEQSVLRFEQLQVETSLGEFIFSAVDCFDAPLGFVEEDGLVEYEVRHLMLNSKAHSRFAQLNHWGHRADQVVKPALERSMAAVLELFGANIAHVAVKVAQCRYEEPQLFKRQWLRTLRVRFSSNVLLPWDLGLGKAVAHGFGTLTRLREHD